MIHKFKGHYLDTKNPSIIENIMGINLIKTKAPMLAALFVTLVRM